MKTFKRLKTWVIISTVILLLSITSVIVFAAKPEPLGEFLLELYEDISSEYGHTINGMYRVLTVIASIYTAFFFIMHEILVYISLRSSGETIEGKDEEISEKKEEIKEMKAKKEKKQKENKRFLFHLGKQKKTEEVAKDVETVVETTTTVVNRTQKDPAVSNFLKNLNNK